MQHDYHANRLKRYPWILHAALILLAGAAPDAAASGSHVYTVSIDYAMSRLAVQARFSPNVDLVTARSRHAGKLLIDARDCDSAEQIRLQNRRMLLPPGGVGCINYTVDLKRAARQQRQNRYLLPRNVIVSPSLWLWRPELNDSTELRLRFQLPQDVRVSVRWQLISSDRQEYRLLRSPESANAPAAFGNFDYREIGVPGAMLRVSLLKARGAMDTQAIINWIRATATDVSLAYGRFPNPSPHVVIVPVGHSRNRNQSAVPYGRVIRDGGESVELFVDQSRPIQALLEDWTATHEFSHLMLPYLRNRQKWVAEGFAQYYQNVLLARSGAYDDLTAWRKLYEGFEQGRQSRPELSPNEAAAGGIWSGLMKVYWSGAALALMADVRLRERSGGQESLDAVLGRLRECCLPSDRVWSGQELFEKMDSLTDRPVFVLLYRRQADTAGFPDVRPLLERLGLFVSDGQLRLNGDAALADIRLAITETNTAAADWRRELIASSPEMGTDPSGFVPNGSVPVFR
ncbi:MAG: hypothetical protein ACE5OQ_04200 [Woeseia sp.]